MSLETYSFLNLIFVYVVYVETHVFWTEYRCRRRTESSHHSYDNFQYHHYAMVSTFLSFQKTHIKIQQNFCITMTNSNMVTNFDLELGYGHLGKDDLQALIRNPCCL